MSEVSYSVPYIPFYKVPPAQIINLDELETLWFKRVAILKLIELESESAGEDFEKLHKRVKSQLEKQSVDLKLFEGKDNDAIIADNTAHFMLRLAYCRNEEYRRWLITQETRLFRHILFAQTEKNEVSMSKILKSKSLNYEEVSKEEWELLKFQISFDKTNIIDKKIYEQKLSKFNEIQEDDSKQGLKLELLRIKQSEEGLRNQYYKFNFLNGLALVGKRKCFVHKGYIYLHQSQLFTIIAEEFRKELTEVLQFTYRHLPVIIKDQRLNELLKYVSRKELLDFDYDEKQNVTGKVNLANIDFFAKSVHYPPCMKVLHEKLTDDCHLKHYGRLQYGLFIKGTGLSLDESMQFWKKKFSGKFDGEKFDRQYAYNIRHSYGKEGKRTDYTPWAWNKIISQVPGNTEYHGWPFKYFKDELMLDFLIKKYDLTSDSIIPIMEKKREGAWQIAWIKLWDATHSIDTKDNVGNHPNAYFSSSLESVAASESRGDRGTSNKR